MTDQAGAAEFRICPKEARQAFYLSAAGGVLGGAYLCWSQGWRPLAGVTIAAAIARFSPTTHVDL